MQRFLASLGYYCRKKEPSRRNIKKRIQLEKNSNIPVREDEINEDQLGDEAVSNVFENLFSEQS